jgi:N-acyl-D-aspartate/D-glutamate deacylase
VLDLKIAGGSVIDGTGAPRRVVDVGVRDGRVVAVGKLDEPSRRVVEASGLIVSPGFVDIHTHYDAQLLWDPTASPSPFHGVTTVIGGNCGFTVAPLGPGAARYVMEMLARVEGMPLESLEASSDWGWSSFGDWLDRLEGRIALNAGFLVGHSTIRRAVMAEAAVGSEANDGQLSEMQRVLHESLEAGGLGFSSSFAPTHNDNEGNPVPSRSSTRDELIALAGVVAEHPGTTIEFIPTIGRFAEEHFEEMTALSLAANRPLNWNLLAVSSASKELSEHQLSGSDYAARRGAKVVALAMTETMQFRLNLRTAFIFDAIPGWGDTMTLPLPDRMKALADPAERKRLKDAAASPDGGVLGGWLNWKNLRIGETFSPANEGLDGRLVGEVAAQRGEDPFDTFCDVALNDELRTSFLPPATGDDEESWRLRAESWRDPRVVVGGSDAGAHLDMLATFDYASSMLGPSVRDRHLLGLEEAVHLVTEVPSRLYGIKDRGVLAEGSMADIVVFDEATLAPGEVRTRFDLPGGAGRLYSEAEGIHHVFVNGTEIIAGGEVTGERPGTLLRSGRDTYTVETASAL